MSVSPIDQESGGAHLEVLEMNLARVSNLLPNRSWSADRARPVEASLPGTDILRPCLSRGQISGRPPVTPSLGLPGHTAETWQQ